MCKNGMKPVVFTENSSEGKIILFAVLTQLNLRTSSSNFLDSIFQTSI